ncbi:MAG: class I SAM-dependent methyltransferase [Olsenella sp.]|jgi:O-methyltransferase involved in polyketide biosynthesis|nr:class I SAM-dependent methyltransferase [Olsenella sp.]MCI2188044.1 class I SAM-dependent methyltransferase [Olsenella sp.]
MTTQEKELGKDSVERTLCIPLWCRALAVDKLPQILPDHDAARILREMGQTKPPTVFYRMECACLAGAIRQYDFSCEMSGYLSTHPNATVVEMGAGLSCLRRQMGNTHNAWVNLDFPDVIACREKYIEPGAREQNIACDLTDHSWFERIPFDPAHGAVFYAAGVFHYFQPEEVRSLVVDMAERFPGAMLAFDTISDKELRQGNGQVSNTGNDTRMGFYLNDAPRVLPTWSDRLVNTVQRSYLEGYPVEGVRYNPITRLYIRSKRDKFFMVHTEFRGE